MNKNIQNAYNRLNKISTLAEMGNMEAANNQFLDFHSNVFSFDSNKYTSNEKYEIMERFEEVSHILGIENALNQAQALYDNDDRKGARSQISYAKFHAKPIHVNLTKRLRLLKRKYNDFIPAF